MEKEQRSPLGCSGFVIRLVVDPVVTTLQMDPTEGGPGTAGGAASDPDEQQEGRQRHGIRLVGRDVALESRGQERKS